MIARIGDRIDLLFLNAGRGLGTVFSTRTGKKARRIVDTNMTGTICPAHQLAAGMP
ncbi:MULTISPECIES: hypothetical protein [unclassified Mesorhizobium]|uniref:hypothetical protein n=1 Tax=unclassified Mesorhizobium TaxID=325217 RepID=UPI00142F06D5|nr:MULTISPECIES: hypothetical protein [unclassified Mesorhizobium]